LAKSPTARGKKANAGFDIGHRQAPADFTPRAQFRRFEDLCRVRRDPQELNAGAQRDGCDCRAGLDGRARMVEGQMSQSPQQSGYGPPFAGTLDRPQVFGNLTGEIHIAVFGLVSHLKKASSQVWSSRWSKYNQSTSDPC
jgi:hypothetical protein